MIFSNSSCFSSSSSNDFLKRETQTGMRKIILARAVGSVSILLAAISSVAATTNDLSDAEVQGRELARQLCEARPTENFTNTGVLKIRAARNKHLEIRFNFETIITPANWQTIYFAATSNGVEKAIIIHSTDRPTEYSYARTTSPTMSYLAFAEISPGQAANEAFADSDFLLADLGLEFFHWPGQKVLKHEMRRGRSCKVLESTNPNPDTNGYSRVVSWIDNETLGIVQAEAYDANGKLLKEFEPKEFKKINGQWQLQEMEIRNVQTGSRTRIEFDVPRK